MRRINKGAPCEDFEKFNRASHNQWSEAIGHTRIWREHIINNEQAGVSGYTEIPIDVDGSHIDHFLKQALFQDFIFKWENYVADSCDEDFGAKYKDKHIQTKSENETLINPITEDAEKFFYYEANGKMTPAYGLDEQDTERARFTIEKFNLNHQSLRERRRVILNLNLDAYRGFEPDDLLRILSHGGFESVAKQTLDEWVEQKNKCNDVEQ